MNIYKSALCVISLLIIAGCVGDTPRRDVGARYVGAAYKLDPLGEGFGYDPDPLIRFDAFDCTTFVETVLADGNARRLNKIRYRDGVVAFENRNHFIETDWMENNADIVENVSSEYGPASRRDLIVDKRAWARVVHGVDIDAAPRNAAIEYIAYDDLDKIQNDEPLIVLFIVGKSEKYAKISTDIAVVHMGFLMPGGKILRHASTGRGVVDDDFAQYIQMRKNMKNNIGIALVRIK